MLHSGLELIRTTWKWMKYGANLGLGLRGDGVRLPRSVKQCLSRYVISSSKTKPMSSRTVVASYKSPSPSSPILAK